MPLERLAVFSQCVTTASFSRAWTGNARRGASSHLIAPILSPAIFTLCNLAQEMNIMMQTQMPDPVPPSLPELPPILPETPQPEPETEKPPILS